MAPKQPSEPSNKSAAAAEPIAQADAGAGVQNAGEHLLQVRELLFGEQLRQIEQRFSALEQRLRQHSDKLRDDLLARLEHEQSQREREGSSLEQSLQQLAQDQENRVSAVEDDLRAALDEAQRGLQQNLEQLAQRQQHDQQLIEQDKISRGQLADLLQQLAEQLRQLPQTAARKP